MKKIVITGTAGFLGPYVVQHFLKHEYEVLSVDLKKPINLITNHLTANLGNMGECYGALRGADAVIHLAAIPVAYSHPNEITFQNNVMSTYNILEAADNLGIKKVVLASSESAYGIVFSKKKLSPQYLPIDEDHPCLPEDSYGLSKIIGEEIARAIHRRQGMQIVSLRLGNIITPERYQDFPKFIHDPKQRRMIVWSYIDARDVALACHKAIEKDNLGAPVLNVAADDTSMNIKSCDLIKTEFPHITDIRSPIDEYQTLLSNNKAKEILNWQPVHSWRKNV